MDKFGGLSFSLTKEDINLLLCGENIKNKISSLRRVSFIFLLGAFCTFGYVLNWISTGVFTLNSGFSIFSLISSSLTFVGADIYSIKLNRYNTYMEQLKIDFQRLVGPNRIVNGKSFRLEKSNNVVKDLKKYSFLEQEVGTDCVTRSKQIVSDNLFVGTVSRQYVAVDDNGIIGAINELKLSDVERSATEDGCLERVVTRYEYSLCGADEVRPYEPEPLVRKRTKKKKNPQGR